MSGEFEYRIGRFAVDKLYLRDARESDLQEIVEIYNATIPSRIVSADTEPVTF